MTRPVRVALFLAGGSLYAWILYQIGIGRLLDQLGQAGWMLVPVVLLYGVVYLLNALAWHQVLVVEPTPPPFRQTLAILISGFAVNYLTPFLALGGEPVRVAALEPWLGRRRAVGAVILYSMFHAMSSLAIWAIGLVLAFLFVPLTLPLIVLLIAGLLAVAALGVLLLAVHRRGFFLRLLGWIERTPLLRRGAHRLATWRDAMAEIDGQIRKFYHEHPSRFIAAVLLELASRAVAVGELLLIARGIGLTLGPLHALALSGLGALALNLFFFVPFELGSKEASWMAIYSMFGLDGGFGVYASLVGRIRELIWIGVGLTLLGGIRGKRRGQVGASAEAATEPGQANPP